MSNIKKEVVDGGWINADEEVTVKHFGNIIKVQSSKNKQNHLNQYPRLSSRTYLNKAINTECEYKQNENKTVKNASRSINEIKDIVLNNFQGNQNVLFLTFTCTEAIMDFDFMKKSFNNFFKKLKRKYGELKYFYIIELQKNRLEPSLHIHSAIKSIEHKRFVVPDDETTKLWGVGFCSTERLTNAEKITSYFVKDLLDEANLKIYPKNSNLYYCSTGLQKPKEEKMTMQEFINKYGYNFYRDNGVKINIVDVDTSKFVDVIKRQTYKKRKHKKKFKNKRKVRFIKLEDDKMICDDIYSTTMKKKYFKTYGIKIPLDTKNTILMDKVKELKKGKQWVLLESTFPLRDGLCNAKVIDILDEDDVVETHLF